MNILGIETSCDETAAAIVVDGTTVLANVVNSQIDLHTKYGGVIPEIAARSHLEVINPVIDQALAQAKLTWDDIDAIAVTYAPGLVGSLLIGSLAARTLAIIKNKPLIPVHHILSHFYANFLTATPPTFPCLALTVSGGHSQLVLFKNHAQFQLLGQTLDDAVGEAFDKVAKIIGLPYPGGPAIEQAAKLGDSERFKFTKPRLDNPYDFSFSGLKTAVLRQAQQLIGKDHNFPSFEIAPLLSKQDQLDLAASFQQTAAEILVQAITKAQAEYQPASIALAGGVSANQFLCEKINQACNLSLIHPPIEFCTDNAAMVASAAYFLNKPTDPYQLQISPNLSIEDL